MGLNCGCAKEKLKLNGDMAEVIVFSRTREGCEFKNLSLRIDDEVIHSTPVVRNLAVYFDNYLAMDETVTNIYKSTMYYIRQVGQLLKYLDKYCN